MSRPFSRGLDLLLSRLTSTQKDLQELAVDVRRTLYAVDAELEELRADNVVLSDRAHDAEAALQRLSYLTDCDVWCELEGCSSLHNPPSHADAARALRGEG